MMVRDSAYYARLGRKGGAVVAQRGPAYFSQIGAKGGASTRDRHGREFYARIGAVGGSNRGKASLRNKESSER